MIVCRLSQVSTVRKTFIYGTEEKQHRSIKLFQQTLIIKRKKYEPNLMKLAACFTP